MEIWKDIPGYERQYLISSFGKIYSYKTKKVLSPGHCRKGYVRVNIKGKKLAVHRLVLLAFFGPSEMQVNHKNGIKDDNRLENLEYCSQSQNMKHAFLLGLKSQKGSKNPRARITEEDVKIIRELLSAGIKSKEIQERFNIGKSSVQHIKHNRCWK